MLKVDRLRKQRLEAIAMGSLQITKTIKVQEYNFLIHLEIVKDVTKKILCRNLIETR